MFSWFSRNKIEIKKPPEEKTESSETLEVIDAIKPLGKTRAFSSDLTVITLRPLAKNILEYNKLLATTLDITRNNRVIPSYLYKRTESAISLRDFFISSEGYPIEVDDAIMKFIQLSKDFIVSYKEYELSENRTALQRVNFTLSRELLLDIMTISKLLKNLTYRRPLGIKTL